MIPNGLKTSFSIKDNTTGTIVKNMEPLVNFIFGTASKINAQKNLFKNKAVEALTKRDIETCSILCMKTSAQKEEYKEKKLKLYYVVGYGNYDNNPDADFPHKETSPNLKLELQAYVIVVDEANESKEMFRQIIWKSKDNSKYGREISEKNHRELVRNGIRNLTNNPDFEFTVKTEIKSGDTFGGKAKDWWTSTDDKYHAHIEIYDTGIEDKTYDEILLEITEEKEEIMAYVDEEDGDGEGDITEEIIDVTCPDVLDADGDGDTKELTTCTFNYPVVVNTIEAKNYTDGHFIVFAVKGDKAVFVSKTDNDKVVQTLGENCISPFPNNEHSTTINNGIFEFKTGEHLVWRKLKDINDDTLGRIQFPIQCAFPTVGQSSLNTNQKLIEYKQSPKPNTTEVNYLLSPDKTKITIKVENELCVIDKQAFINANYSFIDALPLQTFNLN